MNSKSKIIIFFIVTIIMFTLNCYAAPAYYYANRYKVDILNVNKDEIEKIEVLAPIHEGKDEVSGVEYEYISSSLFNYYGTSNLENNIKCINYKNVENLKFIDNKCIVMINKINDYQHENYNTYFGGNVFLRITKNNGEKVYTKMFSCYSIVDERSTDEEYMKAKLFPNTIGEFECDFNSEEEILEVNLKTNETIADKHEISMSPIIIIAVIIIIVIICIVLEKRNKKKKE